ncbi:1,4-alpha-glucan branching protein domain-containing protein [Baekduia sp.]|jgi:1,4-alpha-glucan branching enzyme|uniref:1,4-alpha-glucan branching protein domain-containing protein n=1 Tax=Baekduia sp. TaxID=2600305 RepID=UPI002E0CBB65|nr:1,4-alpha-glucan branching protein domain-containing protein [Baekduia sp.]
MSGGSGRLAIVLHSHMPYVEGFGTWPFGEEWLFEAAATVYVPLLELLDAREAQVTLSVTPVLADQLAAPGVHERLLSFLRDLRVTTHALDADGCRAGGEPVLAAEIERAGADYARAADRLDALGDGGLARGLARHTAWTSSATHAVLPLIATDGGVRLQLRAGIEAHRARGAAAGAPPWRGGLWLPECGHAPWLHPLLEEAGVHATCVDLTDVLPGARTPLATSDGPLLVPIDRAAIELVWSDGGYPAAAAYRDSHRKSVHHHHPWANDGAVYDRDRAREQATIDAQDFVTRVAERVAGGGLSVCALDTELLGHHWYEGLDWLAAVLDAAPRVGLEIIGLDDALHDTPVVAAPDALPTTSWGTPRTLWTWDGPQVADLAFAARAAELRTVAAAVCDGADARAIRELLALQSSDWAFLVTRDISGPYPRERAAGHLAALQAALAAPSTQNPALRGLAPFADASMLLVP